MSLAEACKSAVLEQMNKVGKIGKGDSSLAQVCQDAILMGLQPLIEEVGSLSNMINNLMDSLGRVGEEGEKGVLTEALTKLGSLETDMRMLTRSSLPSRRRVFREGKGSIHEQESN